MQLRSNMKKSKKEVKEEVKEFIVARPIGFDFIEETPISEITEIFGNGELNTLREKLNEVIRKIN